MIFRSSGNVQPPEPSHRRARTQDVYASTPVPVEGGRKSPSGKGTKISALWHEQRMRTIGQDNRSAREAFKPPKLDPQEQVISIENYALWQEVQVGVDIFGPIMHEVWSVDQDRLDRDLAMRHSRMRVEEARREDRKRKEAQPMAQMPLVSKKDRPEGWDQWQAAVVPQVKTVRKAKVGPAMCCGLPIPPALDECECCGSKRP